MNCFRGAGALLAGLLAIGCTSLLGIDGDYVIGDGGLGPDAPLVVVPDGAGNGGAGGSGGLVGSGGLPAGSGGITPVAGGAPGAGGADAGPCPATPCKAGEKCCGGRCVVPTWESGCASPTCDKCLNALPPNANGSCTAGACDFECIDGFSKQSAACVAVAAGGSTGSGGAPPVCVVSACKPCGVNDPFVFTSCCTKDATCGCRFPGAPCLAQ